MNPSLFVMEPSWIREKELAIGPETAFVDAGKLWLESRILNGTSGRARGYIRKPTERCYRNSVKSLGLFFEDTRLCDIRLDHLTRYQRLRIQGAVPFIRYRRPQDAHERTVGGVTIPAKGKTPCPVRPQQVNQEVAVLIRILRAAKLWRDELDQLYEPLLPEISALPRALRPEEQRRWLDVARSAVRWNIVHWYSIVAFDTCMSTNEFRSLRLGDINLQQRMINIPPEGSKNQYRCRAIPIASEDAVWALECLVKRAYSMGSRDPQHYLFPFRTTRKKESNPGKPMTESGLKRPWQEVREASGLMWFRMYDTRHTAITRLAEAGVPIAMIMKRAGHMSPTMTDHYTHISDQLQVQSVRMAQHYNGGLGATERPAAWIQERVVAAPPQNSSSPDLIGLLVRSLQQQCGLTAEQICGALLAQIIPPRAAPEVGIQEPGAGRP